MRFLLSLLITLSLAGMATGPTMVSVVHAQADDDPRVVEENGRIIGLVPCTDDCEFEDLIALGNNVIDYMIILAGLIAVVMFVYAGWLYISSQGDTGKIAKAHAIFKRTAIGFIVVLLAWLIVDNILDALLKGDGFWSILG